jgi:hypothetical protein
MGLSQLLAVGRSVRTIKDGPARYKMAQQNLLPKFGGAKAELPVAETISPATATVERAPRVEPVAKAVPAEESGADKSDPGPAKAAAFMEATKKLRPFGGWSLFKNPFTRSAPRKKESGPVQTELSLDAVKPVRNDLSDSDFELSRTPQGVVSQQEALSEPKAVPASPAVANASAWQRLKTRLFRASATN